MFQIRSCARLAEMQVQSTEEQAPAPLDILESWRWRPRSTTMGYVDAAHAIEYAVETR
jgi:hypothetical protein